MNRIEFLEVRNVAFGLWNRSVFGEDADNITKAWGAALSGFPAKVVVAAIKRIADDSRRSTRNGESPFPTVPEILRVIDSQREREQRPLLRPPDITQETVAELERYADEATSEGRFATAEWYANAAAAYAAELAHRRAGGEPRAIPVDLAGVVKAATRDNAQAQGS